MPKTVGLVEGSNEIVGLSGLGMVIREATPLIGGTTSTLNYIAPQDPDVWSTAEKAIDIVTLVDWLCPVMLLRSRAMLAAVKQGRGL